ncbi:4-hydroxy-tetrahydrodipicolinate synthase [Haloactinopolyspora alba]|uniref:4-hydroxy-tetrahydrodipicolinate synthase n=1 Tax=Haloactinopolyspora alba TaxID=648780 RepID=A0A2P8DT45_9ACTN|nr:dihydrodipicolinate synthase family protein [Haloactinopolyspora alba]PSL00387.1 4-hydroxy-tetrahydrodipicolinate synthase [Haloactinopolyspora alba]
MGAHADTRSDGRAGVRAPAPAGVCPVLLTPFRPDGEVDEDGFVRVVDHLLAVGARSVMFPGFASEVLALSDDEREHLSMVLLERTARREDVTAVVSVPDYATHHAVRRAARLVEAGADAINVLPPHQLAPPVESVLAHLEQLLTAVHPVPVVLQHAPLQTGTALTVPTIRALAERHRNLAAVKVESQPPGRTISALLDSETPIPSIIGHAGQQLPDALDRGAIGVQPGCSFTELYLRVWHQWEAGEPAAARRLHTRMLPYLSSWMQDVNVIVGAEKIVAMRRGLIGSDHCRAPVRELDDGERASVDAFLDEFGAELPEVGP